MLKSLTIRNLAVIESVDLEWAAGFSVLTGETGAGKSILIDAIGLAIGTRADAGLVRDGAERAEVTAEFEIAARSPAATWLKDQALDDADHHGALVIRRVLQTAGRGRAFINGTPVTTAQLRDVGQLLIDIFGQSESQTLLQADVQRDLLDAFGALDKECTATRAAAAAVSAIDRDIATLRGNAGRDPAQIEFLRFQVKELDALQLGEGETETLEADHRRLAGAGRLLQDGGNAQDLLYGGDDSIYDRLGSVRGLIEGLLSLEPAFSASLDAIDAAQAQVEDAADTLRQALEKLDLDPERLAAVEARLQALHDLARKHRVRPDALAAHHTTLREQLERLDHGAEHLEALERSRSQAAAQYRAAADTLSAARRRVAKRFGKNVSEIVRTLGMPHAEFICAVEADADGSISSHGIDTIRFDFTANAGQPARALAKVASGGELSRVSLAIQVAAMRKDGAATMIFDEVDAGISGAVAEIVGQRLRALGKERQVLCVTHLAQVAAQGHRHYGIRKNTRGGRTFTAVEPLSERTRVEELARMQGGVEISAAALEHAQDLLRRASAN